MKNKLRLLKNTARLVCTWMPTDDTKNPLTCVWTKATQHDGTSAPADSEAWRLHQCA
jgi:hypothetical protein